VEKPHFEKTPSQQSFEGGERELSLFLKNLLKDFEEKFKE